MLPLAISLLLAIPSPVPAARKIAHTQAPLVLRGDIDAESSVIGFGGAKPKVIVVEYSNGRWRQLRQGDVEIRALGPDAGSLSRRSVVQVAAQFSAKSRILQAGLWVDNKPVNAKPHGGSQYRFTAYGPSPRLKPGRHYATAFAGAAGAARARIWAFRIAS